jgi:hypothetical protein
LWVFKNSEKKWEGEDFWQLNLPDMPDVPDTYARPCQMDGLLLMYSVRYFRI